MPPASFAAPTTSSPSVPGQPIGDADRRRSQDSKLGGAPLGASTSEEQLLGIRNQSTIVLNLTATSGSLLALARAFQHAWQMFQLSCCQNRRLPLPLLLAAPAIAIHRLPIELCCLADVAPSSTKTATLLSDPYRCRCRAPGNDNSTAVPILTATTAVAHCLRCTRHAMRSEPPSSDRLLAILLQTSAFEPLHWRHRCLLQRALFPLLSHFTCRLQLPILLPTPMLPRSPPHNCPR